MNFMYTIKVLDGERRHTLQVHGDESLLDEIEQVVEGETEIRYKTLILEPEDTPEFLRMSPYRENWVIVTFRAHSETNTSEDMESDSTGADWMSNSSEEDQENDVE